MQSVDFNLEILLPQPCNYQDNKPAPLRLILQSEQKTLSSGHSQKSRKKLTNVKASNSEVTF